MEDRAELLLLENREVFLLPVDLLPLLLLGGGVFVAATCWSVGIESYFTLPSTILEMVASTFWVSTGWEEGERKDEFRHIVTGVVTI